MFVDRVGTQAARRPAKCHVLPGPSLQGLPIAQGALQREVGQCPLAALERGKPRETLTPEAESPQGEFLPGPGGQIVRDGSGQGDSIAALPPATSGSHAADTGITQVSSDCWWTVECTARLLEITRHASQANWPTHLHLKRGTRYEPAASRLELRLVQNPPISPLWQVYAAAFASSPALQACCRSLVRFASSTRAIMGDFQSPKTARTGVSDPFSPAVHHVSKHDAVRAPVSTMVTRAAPQVSGIDPCRGTNRQSNARSNHRRRYSGVKPSRRFSLAAGAPPARAGAASAAITIAGKPNEHAGLDRYNLRSIVARQIRAIFARFRSYGSVVARFHPATQKHLISAHERIAGEPDRLVGQISQRKWLSLGSSAIAVRCTIRHRRESAQGIALEISCAPQITNVVFDASPPIRLRTTTRTCRRSAPGHGSVRKAKSAGCDRLHALLRQLH